MTPRKHAEVGDLPAEQGPVVGGPIVGADVDPVATPTVEVQTAPLEPGFVWIRHLDLTELAQVPEVSLPAHQARGWQLVDEATPVAVTSKED